ncbi:hypothetical protein [Sphingomonas baiyangensis]|uniref:C-type lysozyme inhibitor domain-containing protein n=1 Tax=Sphingomonas baiyangensis TaxID=2572576 RepID=A0A4U1L4X8_9SPHN|nr:hypothetical protein [Sphingomonas baiyangensis]TKD51245.1 hypothetical protein FBR43_11130 [Sphingomonas baiyangensis]
MMTTTRKAAMLAALTMLAACGGEPERAAEVPATNRGDIAPTATMPQPAPVATPQPSPMPSPGPSASPEPVTALPGSPGARLAEIPVAFHGVWAGDGTRCARSSDLRLEVAANGLTFYESFARPIAITRAAGRAIDVELELSGEGEVWRERQTLTLGEDNRTLQRRHERGTLAYSRCDTEEDL